MPATPANITTPRRANQELPGQKLDQLRLSGIGSIPTADSAPQGLTQGPGGDIYFAEAQGNHIGRLHTDRLLSDNPIQEYTVPQPTNGQAGGPAPSSMTLGPDGNVWFLDANANDIGRLTLHDTPADPATTAGADARSAADGQLPAAVDQLLSTAVPASKPVITSYPVPCPNGQASCSNEFMTAMTTGPDGDLWVNAASAGFIGRVNPQHPAQVTEYPLPSGGATVPYGASVFANGKLWIPLELSSSQGFGGGAIAALDPHAPPASAITEYPVPASLASPYEVTAGPDGRIWFTAFGNNGVGTNAIGSLDPRASNPATTFVTYPVPGGGPTAITAGPDGNIWFATDCDVLPTTAAPTTNPEFCSTGGSALGRILTTAPHTVTEWSVPGAFNNGALGIRYLVNADGYLWFNEDGGNKIGRISPRASHEIMQWSITTAKAYPWQMTADSNGNLWFAEAFAGPTGQIATLDTDRLLSNDLITEYPVPPPSPTSPKQFPGGITISKDQNIWFSDINANYLGQLKPPRKNT